MGSAVNEELQTKLHQKYPQVFKQKTYIECGDGWYDLIDWICFGIEYQLTYAKDIEDRQDFYATQIKEKYGSLRFYMSLSTHDMNSILHIAEKTSENVCEICGNKGQIRNDGWVVVRCDSCKK